MKLDHPSYSPDLAPSDAIFLGEFCPIINIPIKQRFVSKTASMPMTLPNLHSVAILINDARLQKNTAELARCQLVLSFRRDIPRERSRANSRFFKSLKANTSSFVYTNQLINRLNSLLSYHILNGPFRRKEKQNKVIPFGSRNGLPGICSPRKQIENIVTVRRSRK